jgi:transposase
MRPGSPAGRTAHLPYWCQHQHHQYRQSSPAAEWAAVCALLTPQQPPVGRPRHDHRTVLGGIVWVVRTQGSWRDMPREFGKWETAYRRYRLWRDTGLWQRIVTALGLAGGESPAEVSL